MLVLTWKLKILKYNEEVDKNSRGGVGYVQCADAAHWTVGYGVGGGENQK